MGMKVLLSLLHGQSFSVGECHCGSPGTSPRAAPQPRAQPLLQETPPHARTAMLQGHQLRWSPGESWALVGSAHGSMAQPSELAALES